MVTRRDFLVVAATLAAAPSVRAWAQPAADARGGPILVTLFLRGGMDSLAMVAPVDDADYVACRPPEVRLLADGDKQALRLDGGPPHADFRLHPEMAPLHALYQAKRVAIVHAAGISNGTRSHFAAQELMEHGLAEPQDGSHIRGGWMARWLGATGADRLPAFAATSAPPDALALHADTICATDLRGGMNVPGGKQATQVLERLFAADTGSVGAAARRTLGGVHLIDGHLREADGKVAPYHADNGAAYEDSEIGRGLQSVARVIRMELGIRAFCVDMGGWDTHENQPPRFATLSGQLARAIDAFHQDLHDRWDDVVLIVMSEFGRRLRSNKSNGTDHGHGGLMLVSAPGIQGGRIHGAWPGLSSAKLDNEVDLAVTSDVRSVLAELMKGPLRTPQAPATVFPGYNPLRIGLV